jgi:hypothetical protein
MRMPKMHPHILRHTFVTTMLDAGPTSENAVGVLRRQAHNDAVNSEDEQSGVVRRHYVFGLRDQIPAPSEGWTIERHGPECLDTSGRPSCSPGLCRSSEICKLVVRDGSDRRLSEGLADFSEVLTEYGWNPVEPAPPLPTRRTAAEVGAPWRPGDDAAAHFDRCMALLHETVKALRIATGAHIPNVTVERVWPLYAIVHEYADGQRRVQQLVIVEHGFREIPTATAAQEAVAKSVLLAAWQRNPVERYQDFKLDAERAAFTDGDYVESALKAATAAELLIKHTAWILTWEATRVLINDPQPLASTAAPKPGVTPGTLIDNVLLQRLGGDWSDSDPQTAVGAWRKHVARLRNRVIHLGYRPSTAEVTASMNALGRLQEHLLGLLAAQSPTYPRTALILLSLSGLQRRQQPSPEVTAVWETEDLQTHLRSYLSWIGDRMN